MSVRGGCSLTMSLLLAACGSDRPGGPAAVEYQAVRIAEIGDDDGEGALSAVFGLAVAPDGRLYLSEPGFGRVVTFGPDGAFEKVLGGRGDGPGEFSVPGALFWRGDSLAVSDFQRGISLFAPGDRFVERISFTVNVAGTPFGGRPILALADGTVGVVVPEARGATGTGQAPEEIWLKASRTGSVLDTLVRLPTEGRSYAFEVRGRQQTGSHPLAWAPLIATPPSVTSFVVVEREPASTPAPDTFRVLRLNLDGDTVARRVFDFMPRRVPDEVIDSMAAAIADGMAQRLGLTPASLTELISEQVEWPQYEPPVSGVLVGRDRTVWLQRERLGLDPVRWNILDEDFEPIGQVELAKSLELKAVARDRLWAIELDSLDVPHVVRFEVRPRR